MKLPSKVMAESVMQDARRSVGMATCCPTRKPTGLPLFRGQIASNGKKIKSRLRYFQKIVFLSMRTLSRRRCGIDPAILVKPQFSLLMAYDQHLSVTGR